MCGTSRSRSNFQTLDTVVDRAIFFRLAVPCLILAGFAAVAPLLAALRIYAVLSYSVSQRIPEIGIRMALGESAARIRMGVVGRTILLAGAGVALGAAFSFLTSRLMRSMLYGVEPAEPLAFVLVAATLMLVGTAAGFLPERRASATDPIAALRA